MQQERVRRRRPRTTHRWPCQKHTAHRRPCVPWPRQTPHLPVVWRDVDQGLVFDQGHGGPHRSKSGLPADPQPQTTTGACNFAIQPLRQVLGTLGHCRDISKHLRKPHNSCTSCLGRRTHAAASIATVLQRDHWGKRCKTKLMACRPGACRFHTRPETRHSCRASEHPSRRAGAKAPALSSAWPDAAHPESIVAELTACVLPSTEVVVSGSGPGAGRGRLSARRKARGGGNGS